MGTDDGGMFAPYCPRHGYRLLLGYESVVGVEQTPCGSTVLLRCHCGELLTHDTKPAERSGAHALVGQPC